MSGAFIALCTCSSTPGLAQGRTESEVWKGMATSFATPIGELRDGTAKESLSWRVAFDMPVKGQQATAVSGSGTQGEPSSSPTLQLSVKYVPLTSWFASVTFLKYLRPGLQKSWDPDFTYAFGYDDWHPYTFSAQYANYGGNRLRPGPGERRTDFLSGNFNLSFKFPMPQALDSFFLVNSDDTVNCSVGANLTPRYSDAATNTVRRSKVSAALGCKYSLANNWYVNVTANRYRAGQKQPWDPDYTYGFGYFDWKPGTWSIQYNNYSANRYPWHPKVSGTGRLKDGSVTISTSGNWL